MLFLALLLLLPLELGARRLMKDEPYPALFLPGFGTVLQHAEAVSFEIPVVVATLTSGASVTLDLNQELPNFDGGYSVVLASMLAQPDRLNAEDSKIWLRDQLSGAYPNLAIESLSISWMQLTHDSAGATTLTPTGRAFVVGLGPPG